MQQNSRECADWKNNFGHASAIFSPATPRDSRLRNRSRDIQCRVGKSHGGKDRACRSEVVRSCDTLVVGNNSIQVVGTVLIVAAVYDRRTCRLIVGGHRPPLQKPRSRLTETT